ncbi:L-rhamnose-proton symporter [Klebsiella pneumoniae MGH 32]|uniref:L-rhamnose-proton symporter n=1 Tax=Klebsiella pneumoniae subsp. ozaenae TaxID=574 RepID=A0A378AVI2_KLEPO|nr:L-rhamnose-proton symporter [Klebsiella pneumoniae MGH 32]STV22116.1 L-rhamnose-proton symporter [Klebsiella pneumoniae subsp. ozaenae]
MNHAITMGIFWHLIGAASAACFYAPFKKVKHWSWETMWSVGGDRLLADSALGHQRHAVTRLLGLLPLF